MPHVSRSRAQATVENTSSSPATCMMLTITVASLFLLTQPSSVLSMDECKTDPTAKCIGEATCPACIKILWKPRLSRPPYVEKIDNVTNTGLMYYILQNMLSHCCGMYPGPGGCGDFHHEIEQDGFSQTAIYDIEMPVVVNFKESGLRSQKNVVPLLPHTGVAFVVRRDRIERDYSIQLLSSVFSAWPVLVLTLLLSVLSGIIAWALDTRKNPKEFPNSFIKGACEGFWWAFVSMTTVGYGDRSPKSLQGRAFAVIWILVGICIISIFTATLTTSLTTISLDSKISLPGSKVAALIYSIEAVNGFQQQADVLRVHTFKEIIDAMDNKKVDGALLDSYQIAHFKKYLPDAKYKVQEVIHQESLEYGAHVNGSELATCLRNFRYTQESMLYEMVELSLGKPLASGIREGSKPSQSLFDPTGTLFSRTLYTCLGVVGLFLLLGFAWEIKRNKGCVVKRVPANENTMTLTSCRPPFIRDNRDAMFDEMERRLADELHKTIEIWKSKLEQSNLETDELLSSV